MNTDRSMPLVALGLLAAIAATIATCLLLSVPFVDGDDRPTPTTIATIPLAPLPDDEP